MLENIKHTEIHESVCYRVKMKKKIYEKMNKFHTHTKSGGDMSVQRPVLLSSSRKGNEDGQRHTHAHNKVAKETRSSVYCCSSLW